MATSGITTKALNEQWLGLVQPVGLVVAPAVLAKLELVPNQSTAYLAARQRQLEALLQEVDGPGGQGPNGQGPNGQGPTGQPLQVVPSFAALATELLDWAEADLLPFEQLQPRPEVGLPEVRLAEYGETLRPTHAVPTFDAAGKGSEAGTKLQALVLDLTQWRDANGELKPQWGLDFDKPWNPKHGADDHQIGRGIRIKRHRGEPEAGRRAAGAALLPSRCGLGNAGGAGRDRWGDRHLPLPRPAPAGEPLAAVAGRASGAAGDAGAAAGDPPPLGGGVGSAGAAPQ
jgi:hypothetical protein